MKQIFKTVAVLALAAFSASCAKEQTAALSGGETEVSFTVSAPVIQTRATTIADGTTVDKVACCVYDSDGAYLAGTDANPISKIIAMADGKATFKTRLVTGQEYSFIFWAYKSNEIGDSEYYMLNAANKTVTVNYTSASNDESRDAFYAYVAPFQITGAYTAEVKLYRPFAQLNFGVEKDDIAAAEAAGIDVKKSKVTLTNLANKLNLVDGSVSGEVDAAFTLADCPAEDLEVKVADGTTKKYGYVAMNYILVGKEDKTLTDTKLTVAKADKTIINTLDVTAVPLQGNYRTNVLGNLFTSQFINDIVVVPAFNEPDYEKEIWSGQTNEPSTGADGTYLITKASELAWVAEKTNAGNTFQGQTIQLQDDIDLCNSLWTPIGKKDKPFLGTFDGNDKTITNLNVYSTEASAHLGLFGYTGTNDGPQFSIKNVTIDGAKIISDVVAGQNGSCGVVTGTAFSGTTLENVKVKNATVAGAHYLGGICGYSYGIISGCSVDKLEVNCNPVYLPSTDKYDRGDKAGGILGFWGENSWLKIVDCSVKNATISGYRDLGGICGCANGSAKTFTGNSIENVTIAATVTEEQNSKGENYTQKSKFNLGAVIGRNLAGVAVSNCSVTEPITITYPTYITAE